MAANAMLWRRWFATIFAIVAHISALLLFSLYAINKIRFVIVVGYETMSGVVTAKTTVRWFSEMNEFVCKADKKNSNTNLRRVIRITHQHQIILRCMF